MNRLLQYRLALIVALLTCVSARDASARVRLEHICTVQGQQEVRLTGLGMVIGLTGTGDGAKNLPTVRALRAALTRMNQPVLDVDLKNADSVAVVMLEASIPRSGLRRGQKIDCYVSAIMGAKSLRGGRLLSSPMTSVEVRNDRAVALAGGALLVEDIARPTTAKIVLGVDLIQDVSSLFLQQRQSGEAVTLLIDPQHASFWTSSEVARVVNSEFTFESSGRQIARPLGPGAVEISVPQQYRESPVEFLAQVLEVGIDTPNTQARVILNSRTGTVIVTGEVEISPVIISHRSFSVEVGSDAAFPPASVPPPPDSPAGPLNPDANLDPERSFPFVGLIKGQTRQSPQQLKQLVDALNQLRVPAEDIIAIIRELHATGKLHAELIER